MSFKTSDGAEYLQNEYGIYQVNPKPFVYDEKYCGIYDSPERQRNAAVLQSLRLAFIIGAHGCIPNSILDYGSGNFDFLKTAYKIIPECYAYDIATYGAPEGIIKTNRVYHHYDVISFHDVLEHIPEPEFITGLRCDTLVISLPNRSNIHSRGPHNLMDNEDYLNWFDKEYFHRKPNEHLYHYNPPELERFLRSCGWHQVAVSRHEDIIRRRGRWNIISAAFKRK